MNIIKFQGLLNTSLSLKAKLPCGSDGEFKGVVYSFGKGYGLEFVGADGNVMFIRAREVNSVSWADSNVTKFIEG
jgi:hypothetical protein